MTVRPELRCTQDLRGVAALRGETDRGPPSVDPVVRQLPARRSTGRNLRVRRASLPHQLGSFYEQARGRVVRWRQTQLMTEASVLIVLDNACARA